MRTAVLILAYNRADTFARLLEVVKRANPPRIYVSCDGARTSQDANEQERIREAVESHAPSGKIFLKILPRNFGLKKAVERGLDWVFEQETTAIILEDDLLPELSFFSYCEDGLEIYKEVANVQQISGYNGLGKLAGALASVRSRHVVSPVAYVWGWATWADRWHQYRSDPDSRQENYRQTHYGRTFRRYLPRRWKEISAGRSRALSDGAKVSWDYPWAYWGIVNGLVSIVSCVNLIENHGFDSRATHTTVGRQIGLSMLPETAQFPQNPKIGYLHEAVVGALELLWWMGRKVRLIWRGRQKREVVQRGVNLLTSEE